jgi:hypothetical protein
MSCSKRRVLVTGGSGLVGGRCALAFEAAGYEVVATHKSFPTETPATAYFNCSDLADVGNFDARGFGPDVVVHCAAMTHVDECEASPDESRAQNVGATENMIALCRETGADTIVYMSTDYVFDGASGPFRKIRRANWDRFYQNMQGTSFLLPMEYSRSDWLAFPLMHPNRSELLEYLENSNIQTRVIFAGNITRHPAYRMFFDEKASYPMSDRIMAEGFLLGCHHGTTFEQIDRASQLLKEFEKAQIEKAQMKPNTVNDAQY